MLRYSQANFYISISGPGRLETDNLSLTPSLDLHVIRFMPVLLLIPVLPRVELYWYQCSTDKLQEENSGKCCPNQVVWEVSNGKWFAATNKGGERNSFAALFLSKSHNSCSPRIG